MFIYRDQLILDREKRPNTKNGNDYVVCGAGRKKGSLLTHLFHEFPPDGSEREAFKEEERVATFAGTKRGGGRILLV